MTGPANPFILRIFDATQTSDTGPNRARRRIASDRLAGSHRQGSDAQTVSEIDGSIWENERKLSKDCRDMRYCLKASTMDIRMKFPEILGSFVCHPQL